MAFDFWGVSVHHALGGRPLWLVVNGHKNGPEAQANSTIAGHRLNRILGGAAGHFALDAAWSAYFTRCNEAVVCASYLSSSDPTEAVRAAEAAKSALVDICGGKLSDVTLPALNRLSIEVQLAVRRAISGFGSLRGVGGKGYDLATVILSPDQPSDEPGQVAIRAANDVTNPVRSTAVAELFQQSSGKSDAVGEGVRTLRIPAGAVECPAAVSYLRAADEAITATIRCSRKSRPLLKLLPKVSAASVSPPPSPVRPIRPLVSEDEEEEGEGEEGEEGKHGAAPASGTVSMDDFMWTPSAEAAAAASGSDLVEFEVDFPSPPPAPSLPAETLAVRIAAQVNESVTISAKIGGAESVSIEGTCLVKFMYGSTLTPGVQDSGHCPVPFTLSLTTTGQLASLTLTVPGEDARPVGLSSGQSTASGVMVYTVYTTLPARAPNVQGNIAGDLCLLAYKYAHHAQQPIRASASCRHTYVPVEGGGGGVQHKCTDVILRSLLSPTLLAPTAQVQFLVPLPTPPGGGGAGGGSSSGGGAEPPTYLPPLAKPPAAWSSQAGKASLLWALVEGGGEASEDAHAHPTTRAYFLPGVQAEFKARVPVQGGCVVPSAEPHGGVVPLPLQVRFAIPVGAVAPFAPAAPTGGGAAQPVTVDGHVSAHQLVVDVTSVLVKSSSQVRGMYRV